MQTMLKILIRNLQHDKDLLKPDSHQRYYIGFCSLYEADAEASVVSMRIRQKVKHEAIGEASRLHLRIRTLQNGR